MPSDMLQAKYGSTSVLVCMSLFPLQSASPAPTLVQRLPVLRMWCILPGTSRLLNLAGRSVGSVRDVYVTYAQHENHVLWYPEQLSY